ANAFGNTLRVTLIDPSGVFTAFSIPQGAANYSRAEVPGPVPGTWTAVFSMFRATGFNDVLHVRATVSSFTGAAATFRPSHLVLQPGQSRTLTVHGTLPSQPGDVSASLQLASSDGTTRSVPLTERAIVGKVPATFSGVITGGNGRGGPAQSNVYYLK